MAGADNSPPALPFYHDSPAADSPQPTDDSQRRGIAPGSSSLAAGKGHGDEIGRAFVTLYRFHLPAGPSPAGKEFSDLASGYFGAVEKIDDLYDLF